MNFAGKAKSSDCFAEKCGFLALRFGQGYRDLRAAESYWDSRKAGSGAEVEERGDSGRQGSSAGDGLDKVAGEDTFFVADGG